MKCPSKEQLYYDIASDLTWTEIAHKYGYSDSTFLRKKARQWCFPKRRTILKPSKDYLEDLIQNQGLNPYEIAKLLGYGEGGWSNIYKYCRDYGIKVDFSINYDLHTTPFTDRQQEIVFGTLLGDGYLRPTGAKNAQNRSYSLSLCHGEKQLEYLKWKFSEFETFVTTKKFAVYHPKFRGNAPTYSFNTVSHPFLTDAHRICYPNGKKDVTEEWISKLTPLSLAVWYLDDGSLNRRYRTIVLCTNSFSKEGQLLLIDHLKSVYNVDSILEPRRNNQTVIRINASQYEKFASVIREYVPNCMSYKLLW